MTVSPSVLACDFLNIESEFKAFDNESDIWFHLDIMDGHFVPNLTFGFPVLKKMCNIAKHPLDAHLMVTNPEFHIEQYKDLKLENFTFHLEATDKALELVKKAKRYFPSAGVSIKPNTQTSELSDELLKELDLVLVMSVEPGFGGQSFMPSAYDKISELAKRRQELGTSFVIQVDGGVSDKNAQELYKAGADNLVAGSYIFKSNNYSEKINSLRKTNE